MMTIQQRVKEANKVIKIIASHGRQFFYSPVYERTTRFGLDRQEQVWYVDEHTGLKLSPYGSNDWPGFTHGSTLQQLVARLAEFIKTGNKLDLKWFPIDRDQELWAYGEDAMRAVRNEVTQTDAVIPFGETK